MFQHMRVRTLIGVLVASLLFVVGTVQAHSRGESWVVVSVHTAGCDIDETIFNVMFVNPRPNYLFYYDTVVTSGGQVYMDEYFDGDFEGMTYWYLYDINSRGLVTANFPIPPNQPVQVTMIQRNQEGMPLWVTRVTLDSCNAGNIVSYSYGPVYSLAYNVGFEQIGSPNYVASLWAPSGPVGNSKRICNKPPNPAGKGAKIVSYTGECAYRLKGARGLVTSVAQNYLYPVGQAGDALDLLGTVQGKNLTNGQLLLKVTYENNSKDKVVISVQNGTFDWVNVGGGLALTQPARKVQVMARVKNGSGTMTLDNFGMLLYVNGMSQDLLSPVRFMDSRQALTVRSNARNSAQRGNGNRITPSAPATVPTLPLPPAADGQ